MNSMEHNYTVQEQELVRDIETLIKRGIRLMHTQPESIEHESEIVQDLEDIIEQLEDLSDELHMTDLILRDLANDYIGNTVAEFDRHLDKLNPWKEA